MSDCELMFYSKLDLERSPRLFDCKEFLKASNVTTYPCAVLLRENKWNDYGYVSHFTMYFVKNETDYNLIGTVRIIQYDCSETELPSSFCSLDKQMFLSKGVQPFYKNLRDLGDFKNKILESLNDVIYFDYTTKQISEIKDGLLLHPYTKSLCRDDIFSFEVNSNYYANSKVMLGKIKESYRDLENFEDDKKAFMINLLYGSVIVTLEAYLGDAFKSTILENENYFISFLRFYQFPESSKKYSLKEVGLHGKEVHHYVRDEVKKILNEILFHNLSLVDQLYEKILNISLPKELWDFRIPVLKRHDIFHRNGKDKDGNDLDINKEELWSLIFKLEKFINDVNHVLDAKL